MQIAAATAIVNQNRAEMTDRRLSGHKYRDQVIRDVDVCLLFGCLGKGELETCDDDEGFRQGHENIRWRLDPNVDTVWW